MKTKSKQKSISETSRIKTSTGNRNSSFNTLECGSCCSSSKPQISKKKLRINLSENKIFEQSSSLPTNGIDSTTLHSKKTTNNKNQISSVHNNTNNNNIINNKTSTTKLANNQSKNSKNVCNNCNNSHNHHHHHKHRNSCHNHNNCKKGNNFCFVLSYFVQKLAFRIINS